MRDKEHLAIWEIKGWRRMLGVAAAGLVLAAACQREYHPAVYFVNSSDKAIVVELEGADPGDGVSKVIPAKTSQMVFEVFSPRNLPTVKFKDSAGKLLASKEYTNEAYRLRLARSEVFVIEYPPLDP